MTTAPRPAPHSGSSPRLSVCIPTYNRGPLLATLLQSLVDEMPAITRLWGAGCVEVVVSDNASSDNTGDVVRRFATQLDIVYQRHETNLGPDRNFLSAVDHASGTFCWLMGSDDRIEQGGLQRVVRATEQWPQVAGFCVNMAAYNYAFDSHMPVADAVTLTRDTVIEGTTEAYLTFIDYLGYLSGQVVRRDLWRSVCETGEPLCYLNGYVHVFVIGRMLQQAGSWGYVHQKCVGWRSGNDSFVQKGWLDRMRIDVVGYHDITASLFGGTAPITRIVDDRMARTHVFRHFVYAKSHSASSQSLREANNLLTTRYWRTPAYWTHLFPLILTPAGALNTARKVYRVLKRNKGITQL